MNNIKIQNEIKEIYDKLYNLEKKFTKRNEHYYQKFLEKQLGGTHKRTQFGVTDISTDKFHIEIKHWKDYKTALGQLLSYNFQDNKKMIAYFFGIIKEEQKEKIKKLYHSHNIEIYQFVDEFEFVDNNQFKALSLQKESEEKVTQNYDFTYWLDKNIEYKENSILRLSDVCELFLGNKVAPRTANKYRKEIEQWIQISKYKNHVDFVFQNSTFNNQKFKGWKNLRIKIT